MSFTYAGLKQAIQDYAENDETSFVTNLPVFIEQAEERILKSVQLSLFRKNVSGVMTNANKFLTCPSDFLAPDSLAFTDSSSNSELHYFYRPASLTSVGETGTTWLSENASIAMLYGSLVEAYIYMKGEQDIMALYDKRFGEAIMGLKMLGEAKEVTDEYRAGVVRRPKQ